MKIPIENSDVFVIDSNNFKDIPCFFIGSCFIDSDVIIGRDGYYKYLEENTKNEFDPQEGRYIYFNKNTIRSDPFGLMALFYYNVNGYFAVSNSFIHLIQYLRNKKIKLTVNDDAILITRYPASYINNHPFIKTICNEINIVPVFQYIKIVENSLKLYNILDEHLLENNYEKVLHEYIETTASRINTIIDSKLFDIQTDISGGLDSRAILSLILNIKSSSDFTMVIKEINNPAYHIDTEISKEIVNKYNLNYITDTGNEPIATTGRHCGKMMPYLHFKNHYIGSYYSLLSAPGIINPTLMGFAGSAGEIYKHIQFIQEDYLDLEKMKTISSNSAQLLTDTYKNRHPYFNNIHMNLYTYIMSRNRFHYGLHLKFMDTTMFLYPSFKLLRTLNIDNVQQVVQHDIMNIAYPDLLNTRFDKEYKNYKGNINSTYDKIKIKPGNVYMNLLKSKYEYDNYIAEPVENWWNDVKTDIHETIEFVNNNNHDLQKRFTNECKMLETVSQMKDTMSITSVRPYWKGINILICVKEILA